jgi:hypothetical protein
VNMDDDGERADFLEEILRLGPLGGRGRARSAIKRTNRWRCLGFLHGVGF